jgi:hypothetical protein
VIAISTFGNEGSSSDVIIDAYAPMFDLLPSVTYDNISNDIVPILTISWKVNPLIYMIIFFDNF